VAPILVALVYCTRGNTAIDKFATNTKRSKDILFVRECSMLSFVQYSLTQNGVVDPTSTMGNFVPPVPVEQDTSKPMLPYII
jgi:hypothetical protein